MKNLSEQIDDKYVREKMEEENTKQRYIQKSKEIEDLIMTAFKETIKIVGYRLEMTKQHGTMYYFSFNLASKDDTFGNRITSYIYTRDLFNNIWKFNKNSMTYFRSEKEIDINNLKDELIKLVEDLIKQTEILQSKD